MFGVVPKTIWQKLIPADENNLIPMVTNLFVLKAHGKLMLFDCGLGDTLTDREKKVYATTGESRLDSSLAALGMNTDDIDFVILTHLHTDHAGGTVMKKNDDFQDERTKAVYIPDRLTVLEKAGQVDFIEGSTELFPGIKTVVTGGHTESHFALEIESAGTSVFYYADIFCTAHHMKTAYVPATDLYPLQTMDIKRRTLPRIVNRDVVMAFDHDVDNPLARIREKDGKYFTEPVEDR